MKIRITEISSNDHFFHLRDELVGKTALFIPFPPFPTTLYTQGNYHRGVIWTGKVGRYISAFRFEEVE